MREREETMRGRRVTWIDAWPVREATISSSLPTRPGAVVVVPGCSPSAAGSVATRE